MSGQILKTSVAIVILALAFSFPAAAKNWNQNDEIIIYSGETTDNWGIPWDKTPNYETAKFYLWNRYLNDYKGFGKIVFSPSSKPRVIEGYKSTSSVIHNEMLESSLLSYMLYEKGFLVVDELTPRFDGRIRNDTLLYSHSLGKSLTSYLLGHAICEGFIPSLDHRVNDWSLLNGSLYENQQLIDLVNMNAGDHNHVTERKGFLKTGRWFNSHTIKSFVENELKDTKPSRKKFNYNGFPPNIVFSYIMHKTGNKFVEFADQIFKQHVKTKNIIVQATNSPLKTDGNIRATFVATRYDFLRLAITILEDWKTNNCTGQYLKEIYERRIKKRVGMPRGGKWSDNHWRGYGGFFHTDLLNMSGRHLMGMDGYGGQIIWIDFDNSRILYVHTVHGDYDHNKIALRVIKGEEDIYKLLDIKVIDEGPVIIGQSNDRTTKYDRTVAGMKVRFECLADYAAANDISDLPTEQEIESLTINLEGNDYYRSKRQIVKAGISKEAMDANKAALVRLVNFEGTNDEYCAKPLP